MGAPVPQRTRTAIIRAIHEENLTYQETAALLGIGEATVSRVVRLHRETGGVDVRPRGGGLVSPLTSRFTELLHAIVTSMPDATVQELTAAFTRKSGQETSRSSMTRALDRLGYSRKKRPLSRRKETHPSTKRGAGSTAR
jgi:transposase